MRPPSPECDKSDPTCRVTASPGEVLQTHLAAGHQPALVVAHLDVPQLLAASSVHGGRGGDDPLAVAHRAEEVRVVRDADDPAAVGVPERRADTGARLGRGAVDPAVDDAVGLEVLGAGRKAQHHTIRPDLVEAESQHFGQTLLDDLHIHPGDAIGTHRSPSRALVTLSSARVSGSCSQNHRPKQTSASGMTTVESATLWNSSHPPNGRPNTSCGVTQ